MWIGFLVAAVLVLLGGVVGSYVLYYVTDMIPPGIGEMLPKIENFGVATGLVLSMLGLAFAYRKLARIERVMGGRTAGGRLRRTRISARAGADEGGDEGGDGSGTERAGSGMRRATSAIGRTRASAREGSDDSEEPAGAGPRGPGRQTAPSPHSGRARGIEPLETGSAGSDEIVPVGEDDILPSDAALPVVRPDGTGPRTEDGGAKTATARPSSAPGPPSSTPPGAAVRSPPAPAVDGSTRANMSTYEVMREVRRARAGVTPPSPASARKPVARNTTRTRMLKRELMEEAGGGARAAEGTGGDQGDDEATGLMPPVGRD
jgi:hypothetical protein